MQNQGNLFTRDDTFFGVCQGAGEDFGVPPTLVRIGFGFMIFWNPLAAAASYAALGLAVMLARFLFPVPAAAASDAPAAAPAQTAARATDAETVMAAYAADLEPREAEPVAQPVALAA
jgi:phage shock protein PspC (stress-responsive transcriptional regulator)